MSTRVRFRPEADEDVDSAWDWYERKRAGLSSTFLRRLRDTVEQIRQMPRLYAIVEDNVRAAPIKKFQYVLYYRVHDSHIEVLAVMHGSRDDSEWKSRL